MSRNRKKVPPRKVIPGKAGSKAGSAGKSGNTRKKAAAGSGKSPRKKANAVPGKVSGKGARKEGGKRSGKAKSGQNDKGYFEYSFLVILTMALLALGVVMVFSASWAQGLFNSEGGTATNPDSYRYLKRELVFGAIGIACMFLLARIDYRKLRFASTALMWGSIVLLSLVFTPLGVEQNGARSWIGAEGVITFQPSELAKLAIVVYIAARIYEKPKLLDSFEKLIFPVLGLPLLALVLVAAEPDFGTASIIFTGMIILLIIGGIRMKVVAGIGAVTSVLALASILMLPHQRARVSSYLDSVLHFWDVSFIRYWGEAQDSGFQLVQSLVAIGSGGLFGIGLGESIQKFNYLPEAHTDMILSIIGEELGLVGVLAVIIGFAAFAYIGFRIALKCNDRFGKFVAAGITAMLVCQAAVNVSAATGILPLTGIPLPLISYGGSSLVVILSAVGILLNISTNKRGRVATARFRSIEGNNRSGRNGRTSGSRTRTRGHAHG